MTEQINGLIDGTPFGDMQTVHGQPLPPQNELITHAPFVDNAHGIPIRELPEGDKLRLTASAPELRERMKHEQFLDTDELAATRRIVSGYMDVVLLDDSSMPIETKAKIHGLLSSSLLYGGQEVKRGSEAAHVEGGNHMVIDSDRLDRDAALLYSMVGSEFESPADARFALFVHYTAHEEGHILGSLMAREIGLGSGPSSRLFHEAYLAENPKEAFTGLAESDPNIADERFAEGLAVLTTHSVLTNFGYSEVAAGRIIAALGGYKHEYGIEGQVQIDSLEKARAVNRSIGEVALSKHIAQGNETGTKYMKYEGGLGYASPLGLQEVRDVLSFYAQHNGDRVLVDNSPEAWRARHDEVTGGKVNPSLQARLERRQEQKSIEVAVKTTLNNYAPAITESPVNALDEAAAPAKKRKGIFRRKQR